MQGFFMRTTKTLIRQRGLDYSLDAHIRRCVFSRCDSVDCDVNKADNLCSSLHSLVILNLQHGANPNICNTTALRKR